MNNCTPVEHMERYTEGSGIEKVEALPEILVYNKVEAGKKKFRVLIVNLLDLTTFTP